MSKYLIIPDVHGRVFWKTAVQEHPIEEYDKVIFLGDYLDPYDFEGVDVPSAIKNFDEILQFKAENSDKVVLLLGNHDFYYFFKRRGPSRWASNYHEEIEMMFEDYQDSFQLAFETPRTLFTHAGYQRTWANTAKALFEVDIEPNADSINALLKDQKGISALGMVSIERGGRCIAGSCIWADYHEHLYEENKDVKFQIFGHTLQLNLDKYYSTYFEEDITDGEEVYEENFSMLDCRHAFEYIEEEVDRKFIKL